MGRKCTNGLCEFAGSDEQINTKSIDVIPFRKLLKEWDQYDKY